MGKILNFQDKLDEKLDETSVFLSYDAKGTMVFIDGHDHLIDLACDFVKEIAESTGMSFEEVLDEIKEMA